MARITARPGIMVPHMERIMEPVMKPVMNRDMRTVMLHRQPIVCLSSRPVTIRTVTIPVIRIIPAVTISINGIGGKTTEGTGALPLRL